MLLNFMPGSDSQARKTLMDSFEIIRARREANDKLQEIDPYDFGGYQPAQLHIKDTLPSLDTFIRTRMGGERDGLSIKWVLGGVTYLFDPWTGELKGNN